METNAHAPFHAVYMNENVQYCTIFKMAAQEGQNSALFSPALHHLSSKESNFWKKNKI